MSSTAKITLYYDIVSPWSYLAAVVLWRYRSIWNVDLELAPVYLGGVMIAAENRAPMEVPNKGRWMGQDLPRTANFFGKPTLAHPSRFPQQTLYAIRLLRVIKRDYPGKVDAASETLWKAIFEEDKPIDKPDQYPEYLKAVIDEQTTAKLLKASNEPELKALVKKEAQVLVEDHGAFGMPWIEVEYQGEKHSFFGSDRFEVIAHTIGQPWYGPQGKQEGPPLMPGELVDVMKDMLEQRAPKTICPSEVARKQFGVSEWRSQMDHVRGIAAQLAEDGYLEVTQGGEVVDINTVKGPIRLRKKETGKSP